MASTVLFLLTFLICFVISGVLNIFLRTTSKRNWLATLFISLVVSIAVGILGG